MRRAILRIAFVTPFVVCAGQASATGIDHVRIEVEHLAENPGSLSVGEPLALVVTTTNDGNEAVKGNFTAFPYTFMARYYLQAKGHAPVRLDEPFDPAGLRKMSFLRRELMVLAPQGSTQVRPQFLLNPRTKNLWLPGAGEYQLWVVLQPFEEQPELEVRSAPIKVEVEDPPSHSRNAFDAYVAQDLVDLVFDPNGSLREDPRLALIAEEFVAQFGDTSYGRHVREALRNGLRSRTGYGSATSLELQVYERLRNSEALESDAVSAPRK